MRLNSCQVTLITIVGFLLYAAYVSGDESVSNGNIQRHFSTESINIPKKKARTGLLDTISLSFSGNFDFSQMVDGIKKIFEGIGKFVDLKVIKVSVDFVCDKFFGGPPKKTSYDGVQYGPLPRNDDLDDIENDLEDKPTSNDNRQHLLRNGLTTILGALLGKQQCWNSAACKFGEHIEKMSAKNLIFIMVDRVFPEKFRTTIDIIKKAANAKSPTLCSTFICDPNDPNTNFD